jgi:two-component sensor histidine kinase
LIAEPAFPASGKQSEVVEPWLILAIGQVGWPGLGQLPKSAQMNTPQGFSTELVIRHGRARAIKLANVTLAGQDHNLRYLWVENPPSAILQQEYTGLTDEDLFPPPVAAALTHLKREVLRIGKSRSVDFSLDDLYGPRWYELRATPSRSAQGEITGIVSVCLDITERKAQENYLRILLLELAHRSKNLLAVIQSIANQTARGADSLETFQRRFSGRLLSLSRAHDILTDQNWRGAEMHELIRTQVLMFANGAATRVQFDGDEVYLRPSAAQHIGLALYELTSNALRFGALLNTVGNIKIAWRMEKGPKPAEDELILTWEEQNGPPVEEPHRRNFGRTLLEELVPLAVQGKAELTFNEKGVHYRLAIRASELV